MDTFLQHSAIISRNFLDTNNIYVLPWPANSPELSPIGHVWDSIWRIVSNAQDINTVECRRSSPDCAGSLASAYTGIYQDINSFNAESMYIMCSGSRRSCTLGINCMYMYYVDIYSAILYFHLLLF